MVRDAKHRHDTAHVGLVPLDQLGLVAGSLTWKPPVRVATTASGSFTGSFENGDTIDGVVVATGDRLLIKNQASAWQNGIHTINPSGAPTRATDMDASSEVAGSVVFVTEGTVGADTIWYLATNAPITLGTTNLSFLQFASGAELAAHTGDTVDAHDASAISFTPNGSIAATDVQAAIQEVRDEASGSGIPAAIVDAKGDLIAATAADTVARLAVGADGLFLAADSAEVTGLKWAAGGSGAPDTADYLVATAQAGLSAEIVVGATPGGELGGTWASPTVDATHSGSAHHAENHASRHENGGADEIDVTGLTGAGGTVDPDDVRDAGRWEVIMVPGVTSPPDPLQTAAGDDWVYGWVPG